MFWILYGLSITKQLTRTEKCFSSSYALQNPCCFVVCKCERLFWCRLRQNFSCFMSSWSIILGGKKLKTGSESLVPHMSFFAAFEWIWSCWRIFKRLCLPCTACSTVQTIEAQHHIQSMSFWFTEDAKTLFVLPRLDNATILSRKMLFSVSVPPTPTLPSVEHALGP